MTSTAHRLGESTTTRYVFSEEWEQERDRLAKLEEWLDPGTTAILDKIGVAPGWRCLEIGAGAGSIARWMCDRVAPDGAVTALDIDTRFVDAIDHPALDVVRADLRTDDLPSGFDLGHARLVVEHLPPQEETLRRLVSTLRPGGWLLIEDMDMLTHVPVTPSTAYERVTQAAMAVMSSVGFDPYFGRRLPVVLADAGLEDVQAEGRIPIGTRVGNPGIEMFHLTLTRLRDPIIASGMATEAEFEESLRLLEDPSFAAMPPSIIAAWGRKPSH